MPGIRILGHRGVILPDESPHQNSLAAFQEALTSCDGFETDAVASRDDEVFLIHEAKYVHADKGVEYCAEEHLTTSLHGKRLDELSADNIRQLRLKDGSPIPTLKETLQLVRGHPGKLLNIELKGHAVLEPVLRDIAESGIGPEQLLLSSFNHPVLLEVKKKAPQLRRGALFVAADTAPAPLFPWYPGSEGVYTPFSETGLAAPLVQEIDPDFVIVPDTELTATAINMLSTHLPRANLVAWVFTERGGISAESLISTAASLAPTGKLAALIVDNPQRLAGALREATR